MTIKHVIRHGYLILTTTFVCAASVYLFYLTVLDGSLIRPVVRFNMLQNEEGAYVVTLERSIYYPGDVVRGKFSLCRYRAVTPTVQWALVDTYLKLFPKRESTIAETGCFENRLIEIEKIPSDAQPAAYHFSGVITYKANPARDLSYTFVTEQFSVALTPEKLNRTIKP